MSTQAVTTRFATVTAYLSWDHQRLDTILTEIAADLARDRLPEARAWFAGFYAGLDRHIRLEEELLFPLFEARSGIINGPTAVMRDEHGRMRSALESMQAALQDGSAPRFFEALRFLQSLLPEHDAKEEHVLYPATDRMLTDAERTSFVARLERER